MCFLWLQRFDFVGFEFSQNSAHDLVYTGHDSVNNNVSIKKLIIILYMLDQPDGLHAGLWSVQQQVCKCLLRDSIICK